MRIEMISSDVPQIPINTLYALEDIRDCYFLTMYNLVMNIQTRKYCSVNITNRGYLYVTMGVKPNGSNIWRKVTLHKIIALGRIHNGPYECIEHINDNPFDLRVANLRFSTQQENSLSSFVNGRHVCDSNIFRVTLFDGRVYEGTFREISLLTGIPRATLYYRYANGPLETPFRPNQQVKSIELIGVYTPEKPIPRRSIDYRNDSFEGIIQFDNLCLEKKNGVE